MELKKTAKADLNNKSNLFFSVGLTIALALMLMSFEWTSADEGVLVIDGDSDPFDEVLIDVPVTDPQPPLPVIKQPKFEIVDEDEKIEEEIIDIDVETTQESEMEEILVKAEEPKKEETEEIFTIVEESAAPKGGLQAFYKYVGANLKYPERAVRNEIEGKVYVEFVVSKDGMLTDVKVTKGIGAGCDEETVRIIQSAPAWSPGKQRGRPVRQRLSLAINFRLN